MKEPDTGRAESCCSTSEDLSVDLGCLWVAYTYIRMSLPLASWASPRSSPVFEPFSIEQFAGSMPDNTIQRQTVLSQVTLSYQVMSLD